MVDGYPSGLYAAPRWRPSGQEAVFEIVAEKIHVHQARLVPWDDTSRTSPFGVGLVVYPSGWPPLTPRGELPPGRAYPTGRGNLER
jgi:hypothetical protein